jgi:tRNA G10  N-methylase Trm11
VIRREADIAFLLGDATDLPLPAGSIDYVITDPPHTDEAQFFELSVFYTSWMKRRVDFENEFVINPKQGKDLTKHLEMYAKFVLGIQRVLKPSRYFTVILHEENESILKKCLKITENTGFTLYKSDKVNSFHLFTFRSNSKKVSAISRKAISKVVNHGGPYRRAKFCFKRYSRISFLPSLL